ncbi:hypothetical protein NA57DRAFT_76948 [Rhizodiscina lignyota]|uniref:DUF4038 domain-containing protein n=1 Tax=Rhizodiscina lignyota TaxID=1504668 RepID=A0A9P4M9V3_9PEZI|nr:hypothetical protein NA57DRAFT_76948 [Rhizodiscina lignyota]
MLSSLRLHFVQLASIFAFAVSAINIPGYGLKLSPRGRFFADSKGEPFFWQADTSWGLFHRLTLSDAETYFDDRAAKGFNIVLAVGFTQFGIDNPNRQGDLPFIEEDPTKPNEAYWAHIDSVVEVAWKRGIRVAMVPAWGQYIHSSDNLPGPINSTNARTFATFIGKRYPGLPKILVADTNPWWTNKTAVKANYAFGGVAPKLKFTDWSPVYDELAEGLISGEGKEAMITIHCTNQWFEPGPIALASAMLGDRQWLTFDSSQSGHTDFPPNPPIPWWNARRGYEPVELMYQSPKRRPLVDNEAHYESRYDNGNSTYSYWNASDVRIGSFQAVFSGASGATYGNDNVMQAYVPGLYEQDGSGPAESWVDALQAPGAAQMQNIKKVICDRKGDYFSRVPAQEILVGDTGVNDQHVVATRDTGGEYALVYTPTGKPVTVRMNALRLKSKNVKASWFDPIAGTYTAFDFDGASAGASHTFTSPNNGSHSDWVLVLES